MRTAALLLAVLGLACANPLSPPNVPPELEGSWNAGGAIGDGGMSWYLEYRFHGHRFEMQGYPPIGAAGTVEVVAQEGRRIDLRLHHDATEYQEAHIEEASVAVSEDGKTLHWGDREFHRGD